MDALTLDAMQPELFEHHVLPHLGPGDLMCWLMTTRGRWAQRHGWWERFLARSAVKPVCVQCLNHPCDDRQTLQCVRVDEDLRCISCHAKQPGFHQGDHVYLHTYGCLLGVKGTISFDFRKDGCILEKWPCAICAHAMSNMPVGETPRIRLISTLISPRWRR